MLRLSIIGACFFLLGGPAWGEEDEEDKAPAPETFTDDEDEEPKLGVAGPWDLHPKETPVVAGPWSVERKGSAPNEVKRDGSAREPAPPTATWGASEGGPNDEDPSPWSETDQGAKMKVEPLGAHFPVKILGHEPDALLIEVPMLIAESPQAFTQKDYWLIVEFFLGKKKVGDHRIMVSKHTLATMGPTHAWVKTMIPTPQPQGEITIRVLRMDAQSSEVTPKFERTLKFGK